MLINEEIRTSGNPGLRIFTLRCTSLEQPLQASRHPYCLPVSTLNKDRQEFSSLGPRPKARTAIPTRNSAPAVRTSRELSGSLAKHYELPRKKPALWPSSKLSAPLQAKPQRRNSAQPLQKPHQRQPKPTNSTVPKPSAVHLPQRVVCRSVRGAT